MNKEERYKKISEVQFIQPDENAWNLEDAVHVWKFPARATGFSFLTSEEKKIMARFRREDDRNRFSAGRQSLRIILSKYLSMNPMDISFFAEEGRKPFISKPDTEIHFNISHSGDWVLIAFAMDEQGVDVEKINREFDFVGLLEDHFSETEKSFISEAADPVSAFYYLWTRKEAITKAWGTGLQDYMKEVSVLNEGSSLNLHQKTWKIESFHISAFYPAAIAYPGEMENLRYFDGSSTFLNF